MDKHPIGSTFAQKLIAVAFLVTFSFATLPSEAHAADYDSPIQVANSIIGVAHNTITAVTASAENTKEYVLDPLAWAVGKLAIQSLTKSLVTWINSGFQGKPAFVTDLKQNLRGVGDAVAQRFFDDLSSHAIVPMPGQDKVIDAVRLGYYLSTSPESFYTRHPYTLDQVSSNDSKFLQGDFSQGGWNAWFATVMNPTDNPYAAQELLNRELSSAVSSEQAARTEELNWNKGFLSWRSCPKPAAGAATSLSDTDTCVGYEIQTPGSVIVDQLNKTLGSNVDSLVSADEFDEIIGALMNQLVGHVLGVNDNNGLRGVSQATSGGGSSYLDQATGASLATVNASASANLTKTIATQGKSIDDYKAEWQKILDAANDAKTKCGADVGDPTPASVILQATEALAKAANATNALSDISARVTAATSAGNEQTSTLATIANDFQNLLTSDTLPSADGITNAQLQSQDSGDSANVSLYTAMTKLADTNASCVQSI